MKQNFDPPADPFGNEAETPDANGEWHCPKCRRKRRTYRENNDSAYCAVDGKPMVWKPDERPDESEQEKKVLDCCREWYRNASDIARQALWYEIGVMLENEDDQGIQRTGDICPECGGYFHQFSCETCGYPNETN